MEPRHREQTLRHPAELPRGILRVEGSEAHMMRVGVVYPQTEFGNDPAAIRDYAQTAEALGFVPGKGG